MAKRKGRNDRLEARARSYYDPAANRGRVKPIGIIRSPNALIGPVTGSRQHRRTRQRLSFYEQMMLAKSKGFPTPGSRDLAPEQQWIDLWEEAYARG